MKPSEVNEKNEKIVYNNLYGDDEDINNNFIQYTFNIGDYVRRVLKKNLFDKGYTQNWSSEIFIISMLNPTNPPTYNIKSTENISMPHLYYKEELQKIKQEIFPFDTYRVYKEEDNKLLVSKLNSENKNKFWISNENVKTSESIINETIQKEENKRVLRSSRK